MSLRIKSATPLRFAAGAIVRNPQSAILLLCLIAFALRLGPAFDNRFHPDEALFSSWALKIARGENVLLTGLPVDKPPLLIYTTAISFLFFGQTEIAARLPNLLASVISVLLVYHLARPSTSTSLRSARSVPAQDASSLFASILFTLSPFAILFAPTAFLDPTMIMFGLASLVAASRDRMGWAGILLGLSFATKVQGLFFAPLVFIFWHLNQKSETPALHPQRGASVRNQKLHVIFNTFAN
jgi:4-amino-4-deoxy-L-arabinose transferase-like glycosyltransferase